jgi:hypothetical protein
MRLESISIQLRANNKARNGGTLTLHSQKKIKTQKSAGKVMASVFWDSDVLMCAQCLQHGVTINVQYYSDLLTINVKAALRKCVSRRPRNRSFLFMTLL